MPESSRRKVLVSAYACEPDKGSEPGVGWNWVKLISQNNEAWVLTRENNRHSIEQELSARPNAFLHFEYVDLPKSIRFWKKGQRGVRVYYYLWQFAALIRTMKLRRRIRFDCGHHVSFVNDWLWTFFALTSLPYVWGPIGSHPRAPSQLLSNRRTRLLDGLRYTFQCFMRWVDPLFWLSAIRARVVLVISGENASLMPLRWLAGRRLLIEPAIGIEEVLESASHRQKDDFNVLFVGRFVPIKAPHLVVEAFAHMAARMENVRLILVGHGPEEPDIRHRIENHGIWGKVEIVPWLPREKVLALMRDTDVFLFPSMEGAGMVVLEAMAAGKPVVCLDFGGPGAMITEKTGVKVKIAQAPQVIDQLAAALEDLAQNPERRQAMGRAAMEGASGRFSWTTKVDLIESIYGAMG